MTKKKIFLYSIISFILIITVVSTIIFSCKLKTHSHIQPLDYSESISSFLNPDQGFYRTACISITPNSVEDKSYIITDDFQLYHLRMDISEFSNVVNGTEDIPLSNQAITQIEELINKFFIKGKNVILRFSYDKGFSGLTNQEPNPDIIYHHITQICQITNKFPYTITAIEAGMIGPWGEMHTSNIATPTIINNIIDKYLNNTSVPILVRTPKMIYDYIGITIDQIDSYTIEKSSASYRLGIFNDGFLGSENDLGTYQDRNKEIDWLSKQTSHLPFGGEVARPNSCLHDIDKCLLEMNKLNLSYLNYEWNDKIIQEKWQTQKYTNLCGNESLYINKTAYEYIRNHLGYRLILKNSVFSYEKTFNTLKINLDIENIGFGELYRSKNISILFVNNNSVYKTITCGTYTGENNISIEIDISNLNGNYNVYLSLNNIQNNISCYPIRFSNNLWDNNILSNLIGSINITR